MVSNVATQRLIAWKGEASEHVRYVLSPSIVAHFLRRRPEKNDSPVRGEDVEPRFLRFRGASGVEGDLDGRSRDLGDLRGEG